MKIPVDIEEICKVRHDTDLCCKECTYVGNVCEAYYEKYQVEPYENYLLSEHNKQMKLKGGY